MSARFTAENTPPGMPNPVRGPPQYIVDQTRMALGQEAEVHLVSPVDLRRAFVMFDKDPTIKAATRVLINYTARGIPHLYWNGRIVSNSPTLETFFKSLDSRVSDIVTWLLVAGVVPITFAKQGAEQLISSRVFGVTPPDDSSDDSTDDNEKDEVVMASSTSKHRRQKSSKKSIPTINATAMLGKKKQKAKEEHNRFKVYASMAKSHQCISLSQAVEDQVNASWSMSNRAPTPAALSRQATARARIPQFIDNALDSDFRRVIGGVWNNRFQYDTKTGQVVQKEEAKPRRRRRTRRSRTRTRARKRSRSRSRSRSRDRRRRSVSDSDSYSSSEDDRKDIEDGDDDQDYNLFLKTELPADQYKHLEKVARKKRKEYGYGAPWKAQDHWDMVGRRHVMRGINANEGMGILPRFPRWSAEQVRKKYNTPIPTIQSPGSGYIMTVTAQGVQTFFYLTQTGTQDEYQIDPYTFIFEDSRHSPTHLGGLTTPALALLELISSKRRYEDIYYTTCARNSEHTIFMEQEKKEENSMADFQNSLAVYREYADGSRTGVLDPHNSRFAGTSSVAMGGGSAAASAGAGGDGSGAADGGMTMGMSDMYRRQHAAAMNELHATRNWERARLQHQLQAQRMFPHNGDAAAGEVAASNDSYEVLTHGHDPTIDYQNQIEQFLDSIDSGGDGNISQKPGMGMRILRGAPGNKMRVLPSLHDPRSVLERIRDIEKQILQLMGVPQTMLDATASHNISGVAPTTQTFQQNTMELQDTIHELFTTVYGMNFSNADVAIILQQYILEKIIEFKEQVHASENPLFQDQMHLDTTTILPNAIDETDQLSLHVKKDDELLKDGEEKSRRKAQRIMDTCHEFDNKGFRQSIRPQHIHSVPRKKDGTPLNLSSDQSEDEQIDTIIEHIFGSDEHNEELTESFIRWITTEYQMRVGYKRVIANNPMQIYNLFQIGAMTSTEAVVHIRAAGGLAPLNPRSLLQTPMVLAPHPLLREAKADLEESAATAENSEKETTNMEKIQSQTDRSERARATRETDQVHRKDGNLEDHRKRHEQKQQQEVRQMYGNSSNVQT